MRQKLKEDYVQMIDSGMFREEPPTFESIMERMRDLEFRINKGVGQRINHVGISDQDLSSGEVDDNGGPVFFGFTDKPKVPEPGM
jgi:hypothetical protein